MGQITNPGCVPSKILISRGLNEYIYIYMYINNESTIKKIFDAVKH